jgi:hypothetical protein
MPTERPLKILPERKIICHLASSQPKQERPLTHWVAQKTQW